MSDDQQTIEPEPTPATEPPRRRLRRSRTDRVLTGVAGGLGEHFGVDPIVFRIGFVAFSLLGGAGLVIYVLAWLFVPEEGAHRTVGEYLLRRSGRLLGRIPWPTVAGIGLLAAAAAVLVDEAVHQGGGEIVLSVALLVAGLGLLAWRPGSGARAPEAPAPPPAGTPTSSPVAAAPRRPGLSPLTTGTLSALLIAGGAVGLADAGGLFDVTIEEFLAGALAFTGLALVVSTWWGRARGLLVVGALLTVTLGFLTAVDVPLSAGFGERTFRPERAADVHERYRLFAGEMLLDLSGVDFPEGTTEIDVEIAFGELHVVTPPRSELVVDAEAEAGELRILGETEEGVGPEATRHSPGRDGSTVRLDLQVVAGEIEVRDATS